MQIEQHGRRRILRGQPQRMQAHGIAAEARVEVYPDVFHARHVGVLPAALAGLEDPFALLGVEQRTAARGQKGAAKSGENKAGRAHRTGGL
ncbi:hypothetical protein D3C78_1240490 [compost metagenome]